MQTVKFNPGDTILTEGEDGNTAFLIINGSVEVSVGQGAKAKNVGILNVGDVFGEMCLIEPGPRSATVKAVTATECVTISYDQFINSIQENPEGAVVFMKTLVRRLREMNDRITKMDPAKRGLREILRDWQKSLEPSDADKLILKDLPRHWPMMW